MRKLCVGICLAAFCLGCPAVVGSNSIMGNTFILYGNYQALPEGIPITNELWIFTFHLNGQFDLTVGGVTIPGEYSLGAAPIIANIDDTLYIGDSEFGRLFTTLVLRGGRLSGNFSFFLSDELSEFYEEEFGLNITMYAGTLSGSIAKNDLGSVGLLGEAAEAMENRTAAPQNPYSI